MNRKRRMSGLRLVVAVALMLGITSCFDGGGEAAKPVTATVLLQAPEDVALGSSGQTVTLTGSIASYTARVDEQGRALFADIIPDVYNASVSWTIGAEEYRAATGKEVGNVDFNVNGSLFDVVVSKDMQISIRLNIAEQQSLLISKVYYAGCKDSHNKNYLAGRFIEIFNNSHLEVDIAGMYLGLCESESTPAYMIDTHKDYIYLKQVFRFPTKQSYLVQPGQSIVVTNSAIDHTATGADIYNLTNADFECKDHSSKKPLPNNPATPAMELVYSTYPSISNMNLTQAGYTSLVLFKTTEDVQTWDQVYADGKAKGNRFLKTPAKYVVDGVEVLKNSATGIETAKKRLYGFIDAGYTHITSATGYTGEVVYRKLDKVIEGRRVLADANNSIGDWAVATREEAIRIGEYK